MTNQTPEQVTPSDQAAPAVVAPSAPPVIVTPTVADPAQPAPSPDQPAAPVAITPDPAPAPTSSTSSAPARPAVGDLCTFAVTDEAGFETLSSCLVVELFTEPDEDGNELNLARVAILPDERIVQAARLKHPQP